MITIGITATDVTAMSMTVMNRTGMAMTGINNQAGWVEVWLIAGMAIATFTIRYAMFGFSRHIQLSPSLLNALRYVPPVVLTAIVVPEVLLNNGSLQLTYVNARLVGAIAACLVGGVTQNLLITIVVGMAVFFGWQVILAMGG